MRKDIETLELTSSVGLPSDDETNWRPDKNAEAEARAEEFESRVRAETTQQFKQLKNAAQEIYGLTRGRVGVRSPEEWAALVEKAGDDIGNGSFLVRCLGADRYLDPEIVAVLIALRQNLIADLESATAANIMMIDAAIIAYYNMVRTQRWIGDLNLVVERDLFGEEPLNQAHGPTIGNRLEEQLRRLAEVMLPLQERATRMMTRSLEALGPRRKAGGGRVRQGRRQKRLVAP